MLAHTLAGFCALALAAAAVTAHAATRGHRCAAQGSMEAAFTPGDAIDVLLAEAIGAARDTVRVQAFIITQRRISRALGEAASRGVDVQVLADREQFEQTPQNTLPELAAKGVRILLDANFKAAHNKVLIIDAQSAHPVLATGSYNFTGSAQVRNAENVLIIRDNTCIAMAYQDNWNKLAAGATPWQGH
jgi:phosphatidylserine/phosphatidylglycerophosphate/cardiolipin synthase-like enzyme